MYPAPVPVQQPQPIYQQQYPQPVQAPQQYPQQYPTPYYQNPQPSPQQPMMAQYPAHGNAEGGYYPPLSQSPQKAGRKARWKIAAVAIVALLIISSIGIYYYLQNTSMALLQKS